MKALLTFVALAFGLASPASAADLPVKAPLYVSAAAPSWTMFYGGIQGGQNLGKFNPFCTDCGPDATAINLDDNSWFVGGHLGYLAQIPNSIIVVGVEGGVQWLGFKSQAELAPAIPATEETPAVAAVLLQQRLDWLAYAGGRACLTPVASILVCGNGGVAWTHFKGEVINLADLSTLSTQSLTGFYVGGSVDYKVTENVILGLEFRQYEFGKVQPIVALGVPSDDLSMRQIMGRLSFKFN